MKKLTVVGRGTVGCLTVAHFLRWTDWEIEWIFDSSIQTTPVGEGTTLSLPITLSESISFDGVDMDHVYATPKLGIWKRNWGKGKEYKHAFLSGSTGIHMSAVLLQDYIFNNLIKNKRVKAIDKNCDDYENLDSDYVIVCTGTPNFNNDYFIRTSIPVNACKVYQCPWEYSRFNYSITFAMKHGWIFGIPLQNRCAIGYLHNSSFTNMSEIDEDVQDILDEFKLIPETSREINFKNYSRKTNFTKKVCYNGNASFFLEPLEATSTSFADHINRLVFDHLKNNLYNVNQLNSIYRNELNNIESMICLHYFSGSIYDNKFWSYAKLKGRENIINTLNKKNDFSLIIKEVIKEYDNFEKRKSGEYVQTLFEEKNAHVSTWSINSFYQNIKGLEIKEELIEIIK